MHTKQIQYP